jgi:general secretion pathway protein M
LKLNKNEFLQRLETLSPRERILSIGVIVFIIFYALYQLVISPIAAEKILLEQKMNAQQRIYQSIKKTSLEVAELRKNQQDTAVDSIEGQSIITVIDASSHELDIKSAIKRMIPEGADKVTLWLENIAFDKLTLWLAVLETKHSITVEQISISREQTNKGTVTAKLLLSH